MINHMPYPGKHSKLGNGTIAYTTCTQAEENFINTLNSFPFYQEFMVKIQLQWFGSHIAISEKLYKQHNNTVDQCTSMSL